MTGHVDVDVLADRRGVDVDVDDLGLGGEVGQVAGDAVVEAGADGDEAVGFLHGVVGEGAAVHAQHVEALGVALVERAQPQEGGGAGDIGLVGELAQDPVSSGDDGPAADVQNRALADG